MVTKTKKVTPEALKLKTCKKKVRIEGVFTECGRGYLGDYCPDRNKHLLPFPTGFCNNGWCEGTKAKDWKGRPVPTCDFIHTCPCACHTDYDRLFAMAGKDRIPVENSGYTPEPHTFWMPEPFDSVPYDVLSIPDGIDPHTADERPVAVPVAPPVTRSFVPTPTGKTPKGQLESWVKEACDVWIIEEPGFPCTPQWLSNEIAHTQGIAPPSVGAISAVFERWIKLGFAKIEKKPTRFKGYTDEGLKFGLERMKEKSKTRRRLQIADDRRNLRRTK